MSRRVKFFAAAALLASGIYLSGCGSTGLTTRAPGRTIDTYDLGKISVVVYPDADSLIDRLDPIRRLVMDAAHGRTYGYVENPTSAKPTIHTVNDLPTFLHELKHYLDPEWRHPYGCTGRVGRDDCLEPHVTRKAIGGRQ